MTEQCRSSTPAYYRKCKMKARYGDRLAAELSRTMDRALMLGELICEKRAADWTAKAALIPKPPPKAKPVLPRVPRFNDWGMES